MDRDTAIYLAQKAGISQEWIPIVPALPDFLERFAALCEARGFERGMAGFAEAIKLENGTIRRYTPMGSTSSAMACLDLPPGWDFKPVHERCPQCGCDLCNEFVDTEQKPGW